MSIEQPLNSLKKELIAMMELVQKQITDSRECILKFDQDLADEIRSVEKVVNRFDNSIDKKCESLIALYNPVASDLRFALASNRIGSNLERIGDLAFGIANYVRKEIIDEPFDEKLIEKTRFNELYEVTILQVQESIDSFVNEDEELARKVLKNDQLVRSIHKNTVDQIAKNVKSDKTSSLKTGLYLFSIMNKLERISGLCTNISEETVYYLEAEVLKHQKIKLKKKELKNLLEESLGGEEEE